MPTSRNRHHRNRSDRARRRERARQYHHSRREAATATVGQLCARLSEEDWTNLRACADAEARGDIQQALRLYSSIPLFEESIHRERLEILAELGDDAPGWLWSRWVTLQVRRPLWTDAPDATGPEPAVVRALEIAYPHGFETPRMKGLSMDVFLSFLYERDWVLRQLLVYDEGRLRDFISSRAGAALLARADHVEQWVEAPMGGFLLESDVNGCLQLTDLATGRRIDVLDLGLAIEYAPGQHFLGRIVPTSSAPGLMFEWRPLPVDGVTASRVAAEPGRWQEIVAERARSEELPCMFSLLDDDTELVSDMPAHPWLALLEPDEVPELPQVDGVISYDDVALIILDKLLCGAAVVGPAIAVARHLVWSLVLRPGLDEAARELFTAPEDARGWRVLAETVPEPARGRCWRYAELAEGAAA